MKKFTFIVVLLAGILVYGMSYLFFARHDIAFILACTSMFNALVLCLLLIAWEWVDSRAKRGP